MRNKLFFSVFFTITLAFSLYVTGSVIGQSSKGASFTIAPLLNNKVQVVSARIASMYGANAEIVASYVQAALDFEHRTGIAAPVIIAIAIHESSFNSNLFINTGNPFGIKANNPWRGPTFSKWHDDTETQFRVYSSVEEAVLDFGNFVKSRSWYVDALNCPMDDYACVIDGLKMTISEPGYSLNPGWDEAVLGIIKKVGLQTLATR